MYTFIKYEMAYRLQLHKNVTIIIIASNVVAQKTINTRLLQKT